MSKKKKLRKGKNDSLFKFNGSYRHDSMGRCSGDYFVNLDGEQMMNNYQNIDKSLLNELFRYEDGNLFWKKSTGFPKQIAGFEVNDYNSHNYKRVTVNGKRYKVHQIIFMMHHGYIPLVIDHIDRNRLNNKIENLRPCTWAQNSQNSLHKKGVTNVKNVNYRKDLKKYQVKMNVNGERKHFGYYFDLEIAKFVAETMRYKYHGKFATNY